MKKFLNFFSLALFAAVLTFTVSSCSDDDNDNKKVNYADLPSATKTEIAQYFGGESNIKGSPRQSTKGEGYAISTQTGYDVDFDAMGNWDEVEAHGNSALPYELVSHLTGNTKIATYVMQNYTERGIHEIKREVYGYEVELTGKPDLDLIFDSDGNFSKIKGDDNERVISYEQLPENARAFVEKYFSVSNIRQVKEDGDTYDVDFKDGIELEFYNVGDLNGTFKKIDADKQTLSDVLVADVLPAEAYNFIKKNYANNRIEEIEKKRAYFEVELYKDIDLQFDLNGAVINIKDNGNSGNSSNVINNLPEEIKAFVKQHFPQATIVRAEKDNDEYELTLSDRTEIEFYTSNLEWKEVKVYNTNGVPQSMILPAIYSYIKSNYADKTIMEYSKVPALLGGGYKVELSGYPEIDVFFDASGKFIREIYD
ncbi:MAG: PepSY-like domain-containing protein [Dysgonomonas sp.]